MNREASERLLPIHDSPFTIGESAPGRTRTCGLRIRSPTLYPTELRAHERASYHRVLHGVRSRPSPPPSIPFATEEFDRLARPRAMRTRLSVLLCLAVASLSAAPSESSRLVVHEWGTFLAMNGSDGVSLDGMYHEEHSLPAFVLDQRHLPQSHPRACARCTRASATIARHCIGTESSCASAARSPTSPTTVVRGVTRSKARRRWRSSGIGGRERSSRSTATKTGTAPALIASHEATLSKSPDNAAAQLSLAYLYEATGDSKRSQQMWKNLEP